ncbi:hypothetical protein [Motilimonas pumila]|nr:hypothetical protein [Motilimonas pumila]
MGNAAKLGDIGTAQNGFPPTSIPLLWRKSLTFAALRMLRTASV